jgi:hypothetical protein
MSGDDWTDEDRRREAESIRRQQREWGREERCNVAPLQTVADRTERALRFLSAADVVAAARPTNWIIRGHLEANTMCVMVGEPGTYKSFLAIDWLASAATGTPWNGHRVAQCTGLAIVGEGYGGIGRRLLSWQRTRGISLAGAPLYISDRAVPLNLAAGFTAVNDALAALGDVRPGLIVVDTLARNFQGDENSAADVGAFVAALDELRRPLGATVLIIHHCGVGATDRGRGSTALLGATDWQWIASRGPDCTTFTATKSKDSALPPAFAMQAQSVDIGLVDPEDGTPVTSAVLVPVSLPAPREKGAGSNQQRAMTALRKLYGKARENLKRQGRDPDEALIELSAWKEAADLDRKRFAEVKNALAERGLIEIDHPHVRIPAAA